jgi:hypothetical protein
MILFAEISDKMLTVAEVGAIAMVPAAVAFLPGLVRWWAALPGLAVWAWLNWMLLDEYVLSSFGGLVLLEMGEGYVVSSFVALNAPFVLAAVGIVVFHRIARAQKLVSERE